MSLGFSMPEKNSFLQGVFGHDLANVQIPETLEVTGAWKSWVCDLVSPPLHSCLEPVNALESSTGRVKGLSSIGGLL